MTHIHTALVVVSTLMLVGCGSIARNAADNTPVNALPLAGAELSGELDHQETAALHAQSIEIQALAYGTLNYNAKFNDFDPATIPSIVGNPSGLDVPIAIEQSRFSNCVSIPSSENIMVTVKSISLTIKDINKPTGVTHSQMNLNIQIPMQRTGSGTYRVNGTPKNLTTLNLPWVEYAPVVAITSNGNTENDLSVNADVAVDSGEISTEGCTMRLMLASDSQQHARF